jgi:hypothetical protein
LEALLAESFCDKPSIQLLILKKAGSRDSAFCLDRQTFCPTTGALALELKAHAELHDAGLSPQVGSKPVSSGALRWQFPNGYPFTTLFTWLESAAMPRFVFGVDYTEPLSTDAAMARGGSITGLACSGQRLTNPFKVRGLCLILLLQHGPLPLSGILRLCHREW